MLLKNLGQKTLSLLLAIAVWLSIRQIISNQHWLGADEKCRRMTCELVAGFWL